MKDSFIGHVDFFKRVKHHLFRTAKWFGKFVKIRVGFLLDCLEQLLHVYLPLTDLSVLRFQRTSFFEEFPHIDRFEIVFSHFILNTIPDMPFTFYFLTETRPLMYVYDPRPANLRSSRLP